MSLTCGQPNFARCLAIFWTGTLYIHFWGLLLPEGILPAAKFSLRSSLVFSYIGSVTAQHSSSHTLWHGTRNGIMERSQRAPPIFGCAAITLGIGPHSSFLQRAQCSHCKRCTSYSNSVRPSVCPSVCLSVTLRYCVKTTARSTMQFSPLDSKMCLVL